MKTDRRAFLESLALAPLVPATLGSPADPAAAPATDAPPAGLESVADALAEAVKRQYGERLDGGELQAVRKKILLSLERAERLRKAARLANADEPVVRFEAAVPVAKGAPR